MKEIAETCEVRRQHLTAFMAGKNMHSIVEGINYGYGEDFPLQLPEARSLRPPKWVYALDKKLRRIVEQEAYINEELAREMAYATTVEEAKEIREAYYAGQRSPYGESTSLAMWDEEPIWYHEKRRKNGE